MQRYDTYKDSGVKWLGEIPSHWEMKHLRNFLTLFSEKGYGNSQLLSVTRERGVILRDKESKEENHNFVPDDLSGYKHLEAGDFVINKMKSWQGSYGVSDYEGIVSPAYFTCKLHGVNPQFFSRAIRSKAYVGFFMQYSKGIRVDQWDLDPSSMKDIPFILPPIAEQTAIANYLDTATAKIDSAIAQQQKMIDLLNERKQIIINNAVTKGLNPNAKMKDSGVEWIGEIPEGWEVRRLKSMMSIQRGHDLTAESFKEGEIPVYGSSGLMGYHNRKTSKAPSIVIGRSGSVGKLHYIEEDFWAHNTAIYLTDNKGNCVKYLYYLLSSIELSSLATQTAVPTLDRKNVLDYCVPVSLDVCEQLGIARYLDKNLATIDVAISDKNKQISLLQERKQIIINDVVTGKVKVI